MVTVFKRRIHKIVYGPKVTYFGEFMVKVRGKWILMGGCSGKETPEEVEEAFEVFKRDIRESTKELH
jgi:hypothetical protein